MADQQNYTESLANWRVSAYPHYERGPFWYVMVGLLGGGLLVTAVLTSNFLLAALIVMVAVVMVIHSSVTPPIIDIEFNTAGIRCGERFFPYKRIDHFWIVYDPPIKSIHFVVPRSMFPVVHIPIDDQNPVKLREILRTFIREDLEKDSEPVLDTVSRILKI